MNIIWERILIALAVPAVFAIIVKGFLHLIKIRVQSKKLNNENTVGLERGKQTLFYFWTPECSQCKWQEQYIQQAAEELGSAGKILNVKKVNAHNEQDFASMLNVLTVPTLVLMDGKGNITSWNPGLTGKNEIVNLFTIGSN
jgi:thiol-disulfide isomerase/thioredoxin